MKYLLLPIFLMVYLGAICQENKYPANNNIHYTSDISGGNASGKGGSISYSIGQLFFTANHSYQYFILEGVQQPNIQNLDMPPIEEKDSFSFTAYPNPFTDVLYIEADSYDKNLRYLLFDTQGNLLKEFTANSKTTEIMLYNLQAAAYLLKIFKEDRNITTLKLIKK